MDVWGRIRRMIVWATRMFAFEEGYSLIGTTGDV